MPSPLVGEGLFQPDAGALDDLAPFVGIGGDQRGEFLGSATGRLIADVQIELPHALGAERAVDRRVELLDDRPRYAGRRDQPAQVGAE